MSSSTTEDEVVQRVLDSFQREFRALRGGWLSRTFMGDAPTEGYARQMSESDARGRITGSVLGVWLITHTEIVALAASFSAERIRSLEERVQKAELAASPGQLAAGSGTPTLEQRIQNVERQIKPHLEVLPPYVPDK